LGERCGQGNENRTDPLEKECGRGRNGEKDCPQPRLLFGTPPFHQVTKNRTNVRFIFIRTECRAFWRRPASHYPFFPEKKASLLLRKNYSQQPYSDGVSIRSRYARIAALLPREFFHLEQDCFQSYSA